MPSSSNQAARDNLFAPFTAVRRLFHGDRKIRSFFTSSAKQPQPGMASTSTATFHQTSEQQIAPGDIVLEHATPFDGGDSPSATASLGHYSPASIEAPVPTYVFGHGIVDHLVATPAEIPSLNDHNHPAAALPAPLLSEVEGLLDEDMFDGVNPEDNAEADIIPAEDFGRFDNEEPSAAGAAMTNDELDLVARVKAMGIHEVARNAKISVDDLALRLSCLRGLAPDSNNTSNIDAAAPTPTNPAPISSTQTTESAQVETPAAAPPTSEAKPPRLPKSTMVLRPLRAGRVTRDAAAPLSRRTKAAREAKAARARQGTKTRQGCKAASDIPRPSWPGVFPPDPPAQTCAHPGTSSPDAQWLSPETTTPDTAPPAPAIPAPGWPGVAAPETLTSSTSSSAPASSSARDPLSRLLTATPPRFRTFGESSLHLEVQLMLRKEAAFRREAADPSSVPAPFPGQHFEAAEEFVYNTEARMKRVASLLTRDPLLAEACAAAAEASRAGAAAAAKAAAPEVARKTAIRMVEGRGVHRRGYKADKAAKPYDRPAPKQTRKVAESSHGMVLTANGFVHYPTDEESRRPSFTTSAIADQMELDPLPASPATTRDPTPPQTPRQAAEQLARDVNKLFQDVEEEIKRRTGSYPRFDHAPRREDRVGEKGMTRVGKLNLRHDPYARPVKKAVKA